MTATGISAWVLLVHAAVLFRWMRGWRMAVEVSPASPVQSQDCAFTVLIPARNEAHGLGGLLDDLAGQSDRISFSVVLINDSSTDDTAHIAVHHSLAEVGRLACISNDGEGKKSALLTGLRHVDTAWAVTLDADVRLGKGWAEAWQKCLTHQGENVAGVAGPVVLLDGNDTSPSVSARLQALDYGAQMGWSAGQLARGRAGSASGANLAVRPETYPDTRSLGPSGDDTLVVQALQASGFEVRWLADVRARVWTSGATSMHAWISQRLRWAGKTKHYPWAARRTAVWMGSMGATQWTLVAMASLGVADFSWLWTAGWWATVTVMNVMYARPVAKWFGVKAGLTDWIVLGLTQPFQLPVLLLAKAGLLRPFGIASQPTWKGRTCTP